MLVGQISLAGLEYLAGLRNGFVGATLVVGKKGDSLLSFRCWKSFRTTKVATPEKSRLSPFFRRHKTGPSDGREISTPGGSPGSKNVQIDSTILSRA